MLDWLGWTATAVFTASYLCKDAVSLRRVQMLGAVLLPPTPGTNSRSLQMMMRSRPQLGSEPRKVTV